MVIQELLDTLYSNVSPYESADSKYVDERYPHTNLTEVLFHALLDQIGGVGYVAECGSMVGGSAIKMAHARDGLEIVCFDPFTGDVNMWDWEQEATWKFLHLEKGIPTIYKRFLANCRAADLENRILPVNCTATVGMKLLQRLFAQGRISALPTMIYLDSAHEPHETFVELTACWHALAGGGVLFGDDYSWEAVRADVLRFAESVKDQIAIVRMDNARAALPFSAAVNDAVLVCQDQWVIFKR